MIKNLSERIAARAEEKKASRGGKNRATFLSLRSEIKQALDDGWTVKVIWETLHEEGKIDFSYQAFRGYANSLILSPPTQPTLITNTGMSSAIAINAKPKHPVPTLAKRKPDTAAGFSFNSSPKKEDLL